MFLILLVRLHKNPNNFKEVKIINFYQLIMKQIVATAKTLRGFLSHKMYCTINN